MRRASAGHWALGILTGYVGLHSALALEGRAPRLLAMRVRLAQARWQLGSPIAILFYLYGTAQIRNHMLARSG
jgi:hypothetical protein